MSTARRPTRHLGQAEVAALLGEKSTTVQKWLQRYADSPHPPPVPDVEVGEHQPDPKKAERVVRGWLPERMPEWRHWVAEGLPKVRGTGGWPKGRARPAPGSGFATGPAGG